MIEFRPVVDELPIEECSSFRAWIPVSSPLVREEKYFTGRGDIGRQFTVSHEVADWMDSVWDVMDWCVKPQGDGVYLYVFGGHRRVMDFQMRWG